MIVAAAIRKGDKIWTLPQPARHSDIIHTIYTQIGKQVTSDYQQGFIDERGVFYDRHQAAFWARHYGQLNRSMVAPPSLFSEDLW